MGVWWVTEAIPIAAASLVPLVAFPVLNIMKSSETAVCYGDSTIFLFAGGFFIAMAMQQWRLHERIALHIIRRSGTNPRRLVLGFMLASACISLWISNAATTMMMIPIALAVIQQFETEHNAKWVAPFGTAVMLGIAYASSIGGVGTIVGTAPNVIFLGQMAKLFPDAPRITFGQWLLYGIPLVAVFIPIAWWIITQWVFRLPGKEHDGLDGRRLIDERLRLLGSPGRGEIVVGCVFLFTALAWVFRQDIPLGSVTIPGWARGLADPKSVDDGTVAIIGALLLFVIPVDLRAGKFALEWDWARRIPWGILLLFGGGLAIAKGFDETGLVDWAGGKLSVVRGVHPLLMIFLVCAAVVALTEFMSNTALTMLMVPALAVTATSALQIHPLYLLVPAVMSASLGFMMPAGTPPNALVFGSGYVTIPQMMRTGFYLNVVAVLLVTLLAYFVIVPVFGIQFGQTPDWAR
jgi:sodium-dependent dicarboxylate transporter 2/3/5